MGILIFPGSASASRIAALSRATIGAGLIGPTWTPMYSGWSIGKAPLPSTVVITGGGTGLTYAPGPNYCNQPPGTTLDTFSYTLTDKDGDTSTENLTITITGTNDKPVAIAAARRLAFGPSPTV